MRLLILQRKSPIATLVAGLLLSSACIMGACATSPVTPEEEKPESSQRPFTPPSEGDPFFEEKPLPKGPKVVEGYFPPASHREVPDQLELVQEQAGTASINRKTLDQFIERGPRYALKLVRVQPAFEGSRFVGYKVVGFSPNGSHLKGILKPGDIVVAINQRAIVRPEDYMAAWESLKTCDQVQLSLVRSGEKLSMSWPVASH